MATRFFSVSTIFQETSRSRLDSYLFGCFPEYSRTYFQQLIRSKQVIINDQIVTKGCYSVKKNDVVGINFPTFSGQTSMLSTPIDVNLNIIAQHPDFLILNKPAGLVVHSGASNREETSVVNGLLYHFKEFQAFEDAERPGIVHRIDRDTSGILIIARTRVAQIALCKMFKDRAIEKTYLAVASGITRPTGTIDIPLGRHAVLSHKQAAYGLYCKDAITKYTLKKELKKASLLEVKLITGRTHQIRVHFAAVGHPLLGDSLYGNRSELIQRQALHAWKISFLWKGKQYSFHAEPPNDFNRLINQLDVDQAN